MLNKNNINLIDFRRLEVLQSYEYSDIIYTNFINNDLYIVFYHVNTIYNTKSEIRLNFYSTDSRLICEDIISFCQYQLLNFTNSKYVIKENIKNDYYEELELKDFQMIYQKYLPSVKVVTYSQLEESNESEIKTFRYSKMLEDVVKKGEIGS